MSAAPTLALERELFGAGARLVAGIDEVGRGAFGGPVSVGVALVSAETGRPPAKLRDSKLLSGVAREKLLPDIAAWCVASAVGDASAAEIDDVGIVGALRLAALRALAALPEAPDAVILDGVHDWLTPPPADLFAEPEPNSFSVTMKVKADMTCASVAAASVVAKVHRDALMLRLEQELPGYGWAAHVGYGTPAHREAIARLGLSPAHRKSWKLLED